MSSDPPSSPQSPPGGGLSSQERRASGGAPGDGAPAETRRSGPPLPLVLFVILLAVMVWEWTSNSLAAGRKVDYSFFWAQLKSDNIASVKFSGTTISGRWRSIPEAPRKAGETSAPRKLDAEFSTEIPIVEDRTPLSLMLDKQQVEVTADNPRPNLLAEALIYSIPLVILIVVGWWLLRRSSDPFGPGMFGGFIRSPAKRFKPSDHRNTFDDVAGMESSKRELQEIVEFLKDPAKFQRLGAQIPKGVLLMGPPGTGKTLLARAVAGEAGVPFYSINGSEFIQMFVGVGASRVRDLFRAAKESAPCIVFIDEIDAVGRMRGAGVGGGHDEREQTLNQILSEMDGFQQSEAVIVVAATNRPDVLDPALLRPGRFDRHVTVDRPTKAGREGILKVHVRKVPLADSVDLAAIAARTIGFSGADLRNLVNEAALNATREGKSQVDQQDFEVAKDRILMGPKREEVLDEYERRNTAYHEAGHALISWYTPTLDPVSKVTIVPRGRSLGVTNFQPEEERMHYGESHLHALLAMALGGRAAEKLVFDEYSAGAESDLDRATNIARRMVAHFGMSHVVGPVAFRSIEEHPFLGKEIHSPREFSEQTAHTIDQEVQRFLNLAQDRAFALLTEHREQLDRLAAALLNDETLDNPAIAAIIGPQAPRSRGPAAAPANGKPVS